jgi:hypothetical protein
MIDAVNRAEPATNPEPPERGTPAETPERLTPAETPERITPAEAPEAARRWIHRSVVRHEPGDLPRTSPAIVRAS